MISRTRQHARMLEQFVPHDWEATGTLDRDLARQAAEYDRKHGPGAWARACDEDWKLS